MQDVKDGYCPYCEDKKVLQGKNDLVTVYPEIAKLYSSNNEKPANQVLYTLAYTYNWVCDKCNGEFSATIEEVNNGYCPYCENKRVLTGKNDFKTMYPHLVNLYSNDNVLPPNRILYTSGFYYKWHCDDCNGDFKLSIDKLDKEGCPYCNDIKVLTGKNDLKIIFPDIAKRYSSNNEKTVGEILYNSKSTYNWNCFDCGGEYRATIDDVKNGYCPYCEGKKVLKGFNDLATTHPHLVKEWGLENYLLDLGGPESYKQDSIKNVYWLCPKCNTHYRMNIDDRVIKYKRGHEPCWKCSGRMKNILKSNNLQSCG